MRNNAEFQFTIDSVHRLSEDEFVAVAMAVMDCE